MALAALWGVHFEVVAALVGVNASVDSTHEEILCWEGNCVACLGLARGLLKC